jgi:hypothetical protein
VLEPDVLVGAVAAPNAEVFGRFGIRGRTPTSVANAVNLRLVVIRDRPHGVGQQRSACSVSWGEIVSGAISPYVRDDWIMVTRKEKSEGVTVSLPLLPGVFDKSHRHNGLGR